MDVISARHNTISCFLHPDNLTTVELMPKHLASFNHVPRALVRLRSGKASIRDWHALVQVGGSLVDLGLALYYLIVLGPLPAAS
jgi:DNA mismatch repair protein MSH5